MQHPKRSRIFKAFWAIAFILTTLLGTFFFEQRATRITTETNAEGEPVDEEATKTESNFLRNDENQGIFRSQGDEQQPSTAPSKPIPRIDTDQPSTTKTNTSRRQKTAGPTTTAPSTTALPLTIVASTTTSSTTTKPTTTAAPPATEAPTTTATPATTEASPTTTTPPTTTAPRAAAPAPDLRCDGWELAFVDNFNNPTLDPDDWNIYDYPGHNNNGLRHPSAVSVKDGLLTITAKEVDGTIISGGIGTRHSQTYGRFEARVRADKDPNAIMSAVILTWPRSNRWPDEGENNIFETGPGASRKDFSSFVHYPDGTELGGQASYLHQASATQWREMVMEWGPNRLQIWRDGQLTMDVTDSKAIPDFAHVMTVQLDAMRTAPLKGTTKMEVDWVRIYQSISRPSECR